MFLSDKKMDALIFDASIFGFFILPCFIGLFLWVFLFV